jgi:AcrR family transcriptional regulator
MMLNGVQSLNGGRKRRVSDLARLAFGGTPDASERRAAAKREGTPDKRVGTKERQERERTALRRAILDAARELFVAEGFDKVSMRKIAERIEYSPAAIYGYFPSKDDIYFALADEGFGILCNRAWPDPTEEGSLEALREVLLRFVEFSQEQPEYFALMFVDRSVPRIRDHYQRFPLLIEAKRRMTMLVQQSMDRGELPAGLDVHTVCRLFMNAANGAAIASVCGRMASQEDVRALAADMISLVIAGLRSGTVTLTFKPQLDPMMDCGAFEDWAPGKLEGDTNS